MKNEAVRQKIAEGYARATESMVRCENSWKTTWGRAKCGRWKPAAGPCLSCRANSSTRVHGRTRHVLDAMEREYRATNRRRRARRKQEAARAAFDPTKPRTLLGRLGQALGLEAGA